MSALVSAVIPSHNYGRFVSKAIESVLGQTYPSIECIVVDDGSKDNTPEVLAGFGDKIRVVRRGGNGPSAARNAGFAEARGEYVATLDADDWWRPEKIARQVACLEENPKVAAVGVGVELVGDEGEILGYTKPLQPNKSRDANLRSVAVRQLWIGGSASGLCIRKRVLDELGGFDESLRAAEDWDLWLRLIASHPIANISDPLVSIFLHGTGTFRNSAMVEKCQLRVVGLAIERWPDAINAVTRRKMHALVFADAAQEFVLARDLVSARRKMSAALKSWPFDKQRVRTLLSLTARTTAASIKRRVRPETS
jgi:glycosyltransferase involved in cell wall biosynthesis